MITHKESMAHLIDAETQNLMKRMVGFRNVAVHNYRELDLQIVKSIIDNHLTDIVNFSRAMVRIEL